MPHPSLIQEEVDEVLAKGAIEPSTDVAGFRQPYLFFLRTLVVYDPYSVLHDLNTLWTYLLCLLSDRYGNLFNKLIMLFVLVTRMLIYIFLLLSITIIFYGLFGNTNLFIGML